MKITVIGLGEWAPARPTLATRSLGSTSAPGALMPCVPAGRRGTNRAAPSGWPGPRARARPVRPSGPSGREPGRRRPDCRRHAARFRWGRRPGTGGRRCGVDRGHRAQTPGHRDEEHRSPRRRQDAGTGTGRNRPPLCGQPRVPAPRPRRGGLGVARPHRHRRRPGRRGVGHRPADVCRRR